MAKEKPDEEPVGRLASSPCLMSERWVEGVPVFDPQEATDVARWRKAERARLLKARGELTVAHRAQQAALIGKSLDLLMASFAINSPTVSLYWPIRSEPDLRPWMRSLSGQGVRVALPVALALAEPLLFREWRENAELARGLWNIPYPVNGKVVTPDIVIAPLVGFDPCCYRLGYGGGFFDRTLAILDPRPFAIGVGYAEGELRTIFPQPHDIPMDAVITGATTRRRS